MRFDYRFAFLRAHGQKKQQLRVCHLDFSSHFDAVRYISTSSQNNNEQSQHS